MFIGVMSGTSLDGVDIVAVSFDPLTLHATYTIPYSDEFHLELLALTLPADNEIERMGAADVAYGHLVGQAINHFIDINNLDKKNIRAIGSHGQTIRHRPEVGFSLQIGDPNIIAELTHLPVVADFRRRDMAAGGQGAPLVPAFHQAIFRHASINRVILNLGGIANISVLPANGVQAVYGFDTGPANILMDAWCHKHTGTRFDENGDWAASGTVQPDLLDKLLCHHYFSLPYPKSTGREDFNLDWLENTLHEFAALQPEDVQATLLQLTARSVADAIIKTGLSSGELWLCGGGAYNKTLLSALEALLPLRRLRSTQEMGLAPTWVEACAFAWLARQRIEHLAANVPAVTGASGPRVLGAIW